MKIATVAASLVLIAGGTTACSNSASKEEFCDGYGDFLRALVEAGESEGNYGEKLKDAASDFEEVGTPDDIPDDAKEGRDIVFETFQELDDDASPEDIDNLDEELSKDEREKADAFEKYLTETCPDAGAELGG